MTMSDPGEALEAAPRGRCPCCGRAGVDVEAVIATVEARLVSRGFAPGMARSLLLDEHERAAAVQPTYGELITAARAADLRPSGLSSADDAASGRESSQWWLPSLIQLSFELSPPGDGRATLEAFARTRNRYSYAVVEELTDGAVAGLSIQPWPLVDALGRARFEIERDPVQIDVELGVLRSFLAEHRRAWQTLGLLRPELVDRPISIGDTFALVVTPTRPPKRTISRPFGKLPVRRVLTEDGVEMFISGLEADGVPAVDISWDARELGKLAYYAAAAGVADPERSQLDALLAAEAEARYMIGLEERIESATG